MSSSTALPPIFAGSDGNGGSDLFVYDTLDFSVDLVSHIQASTTTTANSATDAGGAFFSPDDRYVLFQSGASNLAGGDLNGGTDVFLYDTQNSSVTLLSHASGQPSNTANAESVSLAFSPDSHNLLFASRATNLLTVQGDTNGVADLFLYDTQNNTSALVSHMSGSTSITANNSSPVSAASFSPDGRYVLFDSRATNLGAVADTNGAPDLFLYDTQDGSIDLVSHIPGSTTAGNGGSFGGASLVGGVAFSRGQAAMAAFAESW
jgi:Tol biopolymer transport system component